MPRLVDLSLLRQMTQDAMRVYEAAGHTELATEEGRLALEAAEELLRRTMVAFLPDDALIVDQKPQILSRQQMIAGYIEIQTALAELQDALYRLAQARLAAGDWEGALNAVHALAKIDPDYRDVQSLPDKIERARLNGAQKETMQWVSPPAVEHPVMEPEKKPLNQLEQKKDFAEIKAVRQEEIHNKAESPILIDQNLSLAADINLLLCAIPEGEFLMGEDRASIGLGSYRIGKYPVTNAQYILYENLSGAVHCASRLPAMAQHPVVNVSFNDAMGFCRWASEVTKKKVHLPTDAQWEKAARGTDGRKYPWGDQSPGPQYCNYKNLVGSTTPVGKYSPVGDSPFGCADMAGNVWELTSSENKDGISIRGGAFYDNADNLRCANRHWSSAFNRSAYLGFRVYVSA
jgi:formylglycine-generating enzyme required for sulfatase activity